MMGGAGDDRATFPDYREQIGEDPARFLDRPLVGSPSKIGAPGMIVQARIHGIDRLDVAARWLEVEHRLDRGPRKKVVKMLKGRVEWLKANGERPDRLAHGPRLPPADGDVEDAHLDPNEPGISATEKLHRIRADGGTE